MPVNSDGNGTGTGGSENVAKKNKRKWEKKSRDNAKKLKLNSTLEWGDYNSDFPTSGTSSELELYDFLQRLEKVSTFATTRKDTTARLLTKLRKRPKVEILSDLNSEVPILPEDDVILLTDGESLKNALSRPFRIPLLHRVTANHPSLGGYMDFCIRDLLEHLVEDKQATFSVYDYAIQDPLQRTRRTTISELLSCFQPDNTRSTALNFLDIENRTAIQFCPFQITLQNISTKLEAQRQHDKGKTESEWKTEVRKEFFLLSSENSISTIHTDTVSKDGANTWVLILEGRKIWYFPQHVTAQTVRWLAHAGSQNPEDYDGWVKVELRRGDLLVMPPSFPHAVFTPEDSLAVGGQLYTVGNLGRSIEGLKMQEDYPDISNEDLHSSVYGTLASILRECGAVTTSIDKAQIISSCSLFPTPRAITAYDKLSKASLIDILKSRGVTIASTTNKRELIDLLRKDDTIVGGISGTQAEYLSREEFLEAIQIFCKEFTP
ncbi:MAG: hypothetical protein M1813_009703 [Trichoglossum hirsutum]|nr:MAG: hypothetical protein M1813_009703 [Trichoglossum hirsutum]